MVKKSESATDAENRESKEAAKKSAAGDRPKSAMESLEKHAVPAGAIAAQVDPGKDAKSKAQAQSIEKASDALTKAEDEAKPEDNSLFARMARSGLVHVNDHSTGRAYVGIPPSQDENATDASKRLAAVNPLSIIGPRTGMEVRPKDGDSFTVPDGFGTDANPDRWEGVVNPATGKGLFQE